MSDSDDQASMSAEQRARKRLHAEKSFYSHLTTYLIVISLLFLINALTNRSYWWFVWPALGWGIGIVFHAVATFGVVGTMGREWEERRLKQLIEEESKRG